MARRYPSLKKVVIRFRTAEATIKQGGVTVVPAGVGRKAKLFSSEAELVERVRALMLEMEPQQ